MNGGATWHRTVKTATGNVYVFLRRSRRTVSHIQATSGGTRYFWTPVARSIEQPLLCSTSHACVVSYSIRSLEENFSTQKKKKKLGEDSKLVTNIGFSFFLSFISFLSADGSRTDRVSDTCSYIDRSRSVDSPRPRNRPFAGGTRGGGGAS